MSKVMVEYSSTNFCLVSEKGGKEELWKYEQVPEECLLKSSSMRIDFHFNTSRLFNSEIFH